MGNIILMRGGASEPNEAVIEALEGVLEEARAGKVDGIAIALSRPGDAIATRYVFGNSGFRLFAALTHVQYQMAAYVDDIADDT